MKASKYIILSGLVAVLSTVGCVSARKELTYDEKISRGLNTRIDVLTDAHIISLSNLLLNKGSALTKAEKQLAYGLGHKTIDTLNTTLLGPIFGQEDRMLGRDVPVSLGSDGKSPIYKKLGEEMIVSYFSRALKCFILSENLECKKDIEFIIASIQNRNNGRDAGIQRLYNAINIEFSEVMRQFIKKSVDSEESLDFVVGCMSTKFPKDVSPFVVIDEFCGVGLPKTKKASNAVLRMISNSYSKRCFLQYFVQKGFAADKVEVEKYGKRIIFMGGSLDDLLFVDGLCGGSLLKYMPAYAEITMSRNNAQDYHSGVCALAHAKQKKVKLPEQDVYARVSKDIINFDFDLADIILFCEVYNRPVQDRLDERFNLLMEQPINARTAAESVKIASLMRVYNHHYADYAQEFALKSFCLPVLDSKKKFKDLRAQKKLEGVGFVSEQEVLEVLSQSPNAVKYLPYARDILYEGGKMKLARSYAKVK